MSRFSVRLFWQRPDGAPYSYLSALPKTDAKGGRLVFALNGGMFHPDYKPVGLYIEDGQELVRANTRPGPGNFHLKPNGIFYASEGEAGVLETGAFLKKKPKTLYRDAIGSDAGHRRQASSQDREGKRVGQGARWRLRAR